MELSQVWHQTSDGKMETLLDCTSSPTCPSALKF